MSQSPNTPIFARAASFGTTIAAAASNASAADHIIAISVDGLRPAAIETLGPTGAPTFHRLQAEGAWTHNARTDHDWTLTGPNHSTMVTARPVNGDDGHNYTLNSTPSASTTYHSVKGSYVASMFDVAHDHGLKTGYYYSKSKLQIIAQSYTATAGADDMTGDDDGPQKIDVAKFNTSVTSDEITATLVADMPGQLFNLTFVHLIDPDPAGHGPNWESPNYFNAVSAADGYISNIIGAIEANPTLAGNTVLVITSDHGGGGGGAFHLHGDATAADNYTIPFYVWGAGVAAGTDLYALNTDSRIAPGADRIPYSASPQPIRNGDLANLALGCLGLPPVPSGSINAAQDLNVAPLASPPFALTITRNGNLIQLDWDDLGGSSTYTVEVNDGTAWVDAPGTWPVTATTWTDPQSLSGTRLYRVKADP